MSVSSFLFVLWLSSQGSLSSSQAVTTQEASILHVKRGNINSNCNSGWDGIVTCSTGLGSPSTTTEVITGVSTTSTETLYLTSLSDYSTLTATTTLTSTNSAGQTYVIPILPFGIGWIGDPEPSVPSESLPSASQSTRPTSTLTTSSTTISTRSSSTASTSTTTTSSLPTFTLPSVIDWPPPNAEELDQEHPLHIVNDVISCVPENPGLPTVQLDDALARIYSVCSTLDGKNVSSSTPIVDIGGSGVGVSLNLSVAVWQNCSSFSHSFTIYGDDCEYYLGQCLNGCQTNTGTKSGGTVNDGCLVWQLTPVTTVNVLTCNGPVHNDKIAGTGVNRDEALENVRNYCSKDRGGDAGFVLGNGNVVTPGLPFNDSYAMTAGNSKITIELSYDTANKQCSQEGNGAHYTFNQEVCERLLSRTIDDCDTTFTGSTGKFGGQVTDGCGIYSIRTDIVEQVTCDPLPGSTVPKPMLHDDVQAAVTDFCGQDFTASPDTNEAGAHLPENATPNSGFAYEVWHPDDSDSIIMRAEFDDYLMQYYLLQSDDCIMTHNITFSTKGDECQRKLNAIFDQCTVDGGYLRDYTTHSCVLWSLHPKGVILNNKVHSSNTGIIAAGLSGTSGAVMPTTSGGVAYTNSTALTASTSTSERSLLRMRRMFTPPADV